MLKRFLPREEGFFNLFQQIIDRIEMAAIQFRDMLQDLSNQQHHINIIANYEDEADKLAHSTFELLYKTFITPFDRHDIHHLTSGLDDILDHINRCAQQFSLYELKKIPDEIIELSQLNIQASLLLKEAINKLPLKNETDKILNSCAEIAEVEKRANQIILQGEKKLFLHENNFKEFFKLKDIFSQLRETINSFQDVANLIKGIVLEYS